MRPADRDISSMSCVTTDERARYRIMFLERLEVFRSERDLGDLRPEIAARIGIAPGTAENVRKRRSKGVRQWVAERIDAAFVAGLREEIVRLANELEMALQGGARPGGDEVIEIQTAMSKVAEILKEAAE
jgi:hypothetical protein